MSTYDHEDENTRDMKVYRVEFSGQMSWEQQEALDEFMNVAQDAFVEEIKQTQAALSLLYGHAISWECASDVVYLRTRSRWSEANERELIRLYMVGTPPNIFEWP